MLNLQYWIINLDTTDTPGWHQIEHHGSLAFLKCKYNAECGVEGCAKKVGREESGLDNEPHQEEIRREDLLKHENKQLTNAKTRHL